MDKIGKLIVLIGLLIAAAGGLVWLLDDKLRFLGRLPGDIRYESENTRIYIPISTMLLVSLLLSFIMWLVQRFK